MWAPFKLNVGCRQHLPRRAFFKRTHGACMGAVLFEVSVTHASSLSELIFRSLLLDRVRVIVYVILGSMLGFQEISSPSFVLIRFELVFVGLVFLWFWDQTITPKGISTSSNNNCLHQNSDSPAASQAQASRAGEVIPIPVCPVVSNCIVDRTSSDAVWLDKWRWFLIA